MSDARDRGRRTVAPGPAAGPRALVGRDWRLAVAAGLAFGFASGGAAQMWNPSAHLGNVWTGLVVGVSFALCLLPLAAVTDGLPLTRPQRWAAFTLVGCVTAVASYTLAYPLFAWRLLGLRGAPPVFLFWVTFPPLLMTGILAALGYMHWTDARRRALALHGLKLERLRFARRMHEARLSALQSRVEPAFLFETLADVERLYATSPAQGARVLDDLIVHLRAALPDTDEPASSLAVELRLVDAWLDIVRLRAPDRLTVAIARGEAPDDARMPPMVLLPLVQLAAASAAGGHGAVTVTAAAGDGRVAVTVIGPAAAFAAPADTPAIDAIRERVDLLYGDAARLTLAAIGHGRSQATLEVPYERTDRRPR